MKLFRFFALIIVHWITHSVTFSFFSFSSHMTRKSSQEKSSYRLWNSDSEFWTFIWLVIYQKKARNLLNSKMCIRFRFYHHGQGYGHFSLWVVKMTISHHNDWKWSCDTSFECVRAEYSDEIIFGVEKLSWELLAAKIKKFGNFFDDVIIP